MLINHSKYHLLLNKYSIIIFPLTVVKLIAKLKMKT